MKIFFQFKYLSMSRRLGKRIETNIFIYNEKQNF